MPDLSGFLSSKYTRILTGVLVAQAALFYTISHGEIVPVNAPLSEFPKLVGKWLRIQEGTIEKEVQDVLRADDLLTRTYANPSTRTTANLFVAFFRTQRTGAAPHSPKNCLPGNGWVADQSDIIDVTVPGQTAPISVNRYIVSRGDARSVVLYWYQTPKRVVASEYAAKIYLVADSIRYKRTDTALVRIVVPVSNKDDAAAMKTALEFVSAVFPPLRSYLPS